jgi:hypothetical protein
VEPPRAQSLTPATLLKLRDNGLIEQDQILARLEE